jgi:hypothetical protein
VRRPAAIALLLVLCGCDTGIAKLPHGYSYVQIDGVNGMIVADATHEVAVEPNVKRYALVGDFVVGERNDAELSPKLSRRFGYFIFDTRDGNYVEGLNERQFEKELGARGLPSHPL